MYKPAARADGRNLEFIELYNSNPWPEDVSGYRLSGAVDYIIPAATAMPAQGYLVVAANPADMKAVYGLTNVLGPYSGSLKTSGSLRLHDEQDSVLLAADYDNIAPWPMGADGTGHSIVLARHPTARMTRAPGNAVNSPAVRPGRRKSCRRALCAASSSTRCWRTPTHRHWISLNSTTITSGMQWTLAAAR